ncbi:MAG: hypothetical protein Q4C22_06190 [Bacillota bacterium]|nr:hypothetical protein [Bacillota bacterium]
MKCGVRFCGGCNPRYDRGKAFQRLQEHFKDRMEFSVAEEGVLYDLLLVIGGCTACCASHSQFTFKKMLYKMWDESHTEKIIDGLEKEVSEI